MDASNNLLGTLGLSNNLADTNTSGPVADAVPAKLSANS